MVPGERLFAGSKALANGGEDTLDFHRTAGEQVDGRIAFGWPGMDADVGLGEHQKAGEAFGLELMEATVQDGCACCLCPCLQARLPSWQIAERRTVLDPNVEQEMAAGCHQRQLRQEDS